MSTPGPSTSPRLGVRKSIDIASDPSPSPPPPRPGVRERIKIATLPWLETADEPPFSATELVTMALLSSGRPLTRKEICGWLISNFGYYNKLAAEAFWGYTRATGKLLAVHAVHKKLDKAFRQYDLPVHVINVNDGEGEEEEVRYKAHGAAESTLTIGVSDSCKKKQSFPFFRLPAELRNTIYELVFQYPRSGLYFVSSCTTQPRTLSRDLDSLGEFPLAASNRHPWKDLYLAKPVHVILEPLLTSRQFYNEAMPVFFQTNTLYFPDYHSLSATLREVPVAHKDHVRSVSFKMSPYTWEGTMDGDFRTLLMLPDLRQLCIRFDEETWLHGGSGVPAHQSVEEHPCVSILRQLYGLEEAIFLGCPKLQALLKDGLLRPKERMASPKRPTDIAIR
ncbi:hypothetical protein LTR27_005502 [Elasticomyces elasticus]|nr:hypothetical protein LTR27_005502 [Elasticomyces elasticus]